MYVSVCLCTYVCLYVCVYVCIHLYIYVHIYVYIERYRVMNICSYIYTQNTCIHACKHV